MIQEFGEERAQKVSMMYRIIMDQNAGLNPKAHRAFGLEWDQMDHLIETSARLIGELKIIDMCSQSDGACAVIMASEEKAKELSDKPVWIRDHITVHREETSTTFLGYDKATETPLTHKVAAERLFKTKRHRQSARVLRCVRDVRPLLLVGGGLAAGFLPSRGGRALEAGGG